MNNYSSFKMTKFNQISKVFLLFLVIISLCEGIILEKKNRFQLNQDISNDLPKEEEYSKTPKISQNDEENMLKQSLFYKLPLELFYYDNLKPSTLNGAERYRKFDPSDHSFIRFGRRFDNYPMTIKQPEKNLYKKFSTFMLRPSYEVRDTSFLRFGRN